MPDTATPRGLTLRPLRLEDAAAWERFDRVVGDADGRDERWTAEELAEELGTSWAALETRSRAAFRHDGELAGLAWLDVRPAAARGFLVIDALPEHRGSLDQDLLGWAVARARAEHGAGTLGSGVVDTEAEEHLSGRIDLLRRHGFRPVRHFLEMLRDLSEPIDDAPLPSGLRMTAWHDDLEEPSRLAHIDAFRDHWGSSPPTTEGWRIAVRGAKSRPDLHRLVVDEDGEVAGYALVGAYPQDWELKGVRDAWVTTLGTRREWRGLGVASALLVAVMRRMRDTGFTHASLGVDAENPTGATRLYERHGFSQVRARVTYRLDLDGGGTPDGETG